MTMRYTNVVLTVIAICLAYMLPSATLPHPSQPRAPPRQGPGPIQVEIVGKPEFVLAGGLNDVFSKPIAVKIVRTDDNLPVEIKNYRVPIEVKDTETVPVRIESMPR